MSVAMTTRMRARTATVAKPSLPTVATLAGFAVLLIAVVVIHGFFWGESQPMVQTILDSGAIRCLHDAGWSALTAKCNAVGQPIGLTFLTGMPETMLGWAISWIPGVDAWTAHQLLNVLLDAVAMAAGYLLLRRWGVMRAIALVAPAVYLVSPSMIGLNGFQYTFTGYAFLPLYVYLFCNGIDRFEDGQRHWVGVGYLTGVTFLMVFTDGYSYATALLMVGCVLIWWLWRNQQAGRNRKIAAVATIVLANLVAVGAYSAYINAPTEPHSSLGQFRYFGLDPATLFIPQSRLFWPIHLGYHPPTLNLYGDGGNYLFNYMGFITMGLVAWLILSRRIRRETEARHREIAPLFVAAAIALFLSFGPALKFYNQVNPGIPVGDVPINETRFGLPTSFLFAHVPPFSEMRAVFRWSLATRLMLVFGAAFAGNLIWRSGRRGIAAALLLLAAIEVAPAPRIQLNINRRQADQISTVRNVVMREFDGLTNKGELVLLAPSMNDFLVNAMAPFAGVRTYNVGIDKSYAASTAKWPADVKAAVSGVLNPNGQADRVAAVLQHDANAFVICYFSLLDAGKWWPAPNGHEAELHQQTALLAQDPRFAVEQGTWMAVIRLQH
jgi:hypothetical protein